MQLPVLNAGAAVSEPGNAKLGSLIHAWSIPASPTVCIGKSLLCASVCYASRGHYSWPKTKLFLARNYEFSQTPHFAAWMITELCRRPVRVLRIHCAGDFYDREYVDKWRNIVRRSQRTLFFAYTRTWRDPACLPELVRLGGLPNMQLWFSLDRETGVPPYVPGIRRAYMAMNDADAETAPADCDLIFRVKRKTMLKRVGSAVVCPAENGVEGTLTHTCTTCGICWNNGRSKWLTLADPNTIDGIPLIAPGPAPKLG